MNPPGRRDLSVAAGYARGTSGRAHRRPGSQEDVLMADKSPKKSTAKTVASKSLKEKRADKKDKAASKRKD